MMSPMTRSTTTPAAKSGRTSRQAPWQTTSRRVPGHGSGSYLESERTYPFPLDHPPAILTDMERSEEDVVALSQTLAGNIIQVPYGDFSPHRQREPKSSLLGLFCSWAAY